MNQSSSSRITFCLRTLLNGQKISEALLDQLVFLQTPPQSIHYHKGYFFQFVAEGHLEVFGGEVRCPTSVCLS